MHRHMNVRSIKICRVNPSMVKIGQEHHAVSMKTQVRFTLLTATHVAEPYRN